MKFDKSQIKRILIIKPGAIGDVLLSTPVIENLRHSFPDSEINFLTQTYCMDVLSGNPFLNRPLTYDLSDRGYCIVKNIRKQTYDLVLDLFCNPRTALITFLSGAKYRTGYPFRFRSYAYNIKVKSRSSKVHNIDFNLDTLSRLGLKIVSRRPYFQVNDIHDEFARRFLAESGLSSSEIIGINPSGSWETKVWYPEKFVELIGMLDSKYSPRLSGTPPRRKLTFLLFWGNEKEREVAEDIKKKAGDRVRLIPEVNLKYAAALIKKCKIFISNDTGPMHIAWVMGVPVVGIYGPTNSKLQGPLGENSVIVENESLDCLGCNLTRIKDCPFGHACMRELRAEKVFEIVNQLIR